MYLNDRLWGDNAVVPLFCLRGFVVDTVRHWSDYTYVRDSDVLTAVRDNVMTLGYTVSTVWREVWSYINAGVTV